MNRTERDTVSNVRPDVTAYAATFPLMRLQVEAHAAPELRLPRYPGSTLRSALALVAKRQLCSQPEPKSRAACVGCPKATGCIFPALFEPRALSPAGRVAQRVLVSPQPSEDPALRFSVLHLGDAQLSVTHRAIRRLGVEGLGDGRGRLTIERITLTAIDEHRLKQICAAPGIRVELETPVDLKVAGKARLKPTAENVCHAAHRRIARIAQTLGIEPPPRRESLGPLPTMSHAELRQENVRRRSATNPNDLRIGGWVGHFTLEGNLHHWGPWLMLAEALQIGRHVAFGLGRIKIDPLG